MESSWLFLSHILAGFGSFLINPITYAFVLLIYLYYRRQMIAERQLFAVRIQAPLAQTVRSVGMGVVGGMAASLVAGGLGIVIRGEDVVLLWIIAVFLAVVQLRFLCLAYAAGILALLHGLAQLWPEGTNLAGVGAVWQQLLAAEPVPLLALVAVLHLAEAALVRWNGGRDASPLFVEGKRGRIVGAYLLHSFWLTPLLVLTETEPGSGWTSALYPGWPLFSPDGASWALAVLPGVTGFSALTQVTTPERKAGQIAGQLTWYSLGLLALAYAAVWLPGLSVAAALFALFGHEALVWVGERREQKQPPYFIQSPKGVKVMAVIPGSPAEEMGILPGEIILKVNGIPVREKEELYPALQANPAFCKMEVLTRGGEPKFVQCAVYAGNHHQLGIIAVPDSSTRFFVDLKKAGLVRLAKERLQKSSMGA